MSAYWHEREGYVLIKPPKSCFNLFRGFAKSQIADGETLTEEVDGFVVCENVYRRLQRSYELGDIMDVDVGTAKRPRYTEDNTKQKKDQTKQASVQTERPVIRHTETQTDDVKYPTEESEYQCSVRSAKPIKPPPPSTSPSLCSYRLPSVMGSAPDEPAVVPYDIRSSETFRPPRPIQSMVLVSNRNVAESERRSTIGEDDDAPHLKADNEATPSIQSGVSTFSEVCWRRRLLGSIH